MNRQEALKLLNFKVVNLRQYLEEGTLVTLEFKANNVKTRLNVPVSPLLDYSDLKNKMATDLILVHLLGDAYAYRYNSNLKDFAELYGYLKPMDAFKHFNYAKEASEWLTTLNLETEDVKELLDIL